MILFQFIFATFLFSNGFRSANKIGQAVNISSTRILQWSDTPIWTLALRCWGLRDGTKRLKGFLDYRHRKNAGNVRALHKRRLNRAKHKLVQHTHQHKSQRIGNPDESPSLKFAEKLWVDMYAGNGDFAKKVLRAPAEVTDE